MSTEKAKLRGNKARLENSWPLGAIPKEVIIEIGKQLVHRLAVGHADITGNDFGTIFANAIGGVHRESPLGIADVPLDGNAWSVKTIKAENPFITNNIGLSSVTIILSPDWCSFILFNYANRYLLLHR